MLNFTAQPRRMSGEERVQILKKFRELKIVNSEKGAGAMILSVFGIGVQKLYYILNCKTWI